MCRSIGPFLFISTARSGSVLRSTLQTAILGGIEDQKAAIVKERLFLRHLGSIDSSDRHVTRLRDDHQSLYRIFGHLSGLGDISGRNDNPEPNRRTEFSQPTLTRPPFRPAAGRTKPLKGAKSSFSHRIPPANPHVATIPTSRRTLDAAQGSQAVPCQNHPATNHPWPFRINRSPGDHPSIAIPVGRQTSKAAQGSQCIGSCWTHRSQTPDGTTAEEHRPNEGPPTTSSYT